jgi:brefeldin A-inhibited guanine nucleotide-exchange protein
MVHTIKCKVLTEFSNLLDLQNQNIDVAMRNYLHYFQLPGEGQKVDRVMLQFAQKFFKDNPDSVFYSADAAYTLSYLMMMAQTELHNP